MTTELTHGAIVGGIVTTPDLDAALADYQACLGLRLVEQGLLDADLAASWGAPASAGSRFATLQPASDASCFIRLVEQVVPDAFRPMRSYGWAAYELTVQDVYGWPDRLIGSGFEVVGPPRPIEGLPYFVPMQVIGRGREMIYLNQVMDNTPSSDLPKAQSPVDHIFICVLACADRLASLDWYRDALKLDEGGSYTINYTMINKAFDLPDGTQSSMTMVQKGRLPIIEVDGYPAAATVRPGAADLLPAGNALVTLAVEDFAALTLDFIQSPIKRDGVFYQGRRAATVRGLAGELVELIEI